MITPDDAMRQAHETAGQYVIYGLKAYEDLTGVDREADLQATATFLSGFIQAAATDFLAWVIHSQTEKLREDLSIHILNKED
jgi:hypothetical protein